MKGSKTHVTKRGGRGQRWGTVGVKRAAVVLAWVSKDKLVLIKGRAAGQGMSVSRYINYLLSQDVGPGYDAS